MAEYTPKKKPSTANEFKKPEAKPEPKPEPTALPWRYIEDVSNALRRAEGDDKALAAIGKPLNIKYNGDYLPFRSNVLIAARKAL